MTMCPAMRAADVCTYGENFGPCDDCARDDMVNLIQYQVTPPDYLPSRLDAMAAEIRRLSSVVNALAAAVRRGAK